jgi:CheY-like chemotaxis protein
MPKKRILVTDDHPSIRFLLRSLLETDEFTVCGEAASGGEAILKAAGLAPDLILLDFVMPGMNGGETARTLKKLMPGIPVILFTLDEDSVNEALAATMGVDAVLAKPDAALHLLDCMRRVLHLGKGPSTAVGPLAVPIEPAPEPSQPANPTVTEDKPPQ